MTSVSIFAAVYSLGALTLAAGLMALLHILEPEFDPSWRMLSEYSLGRYGVLMRVAFLAMGTGVMAVAVALSRATAPWSVGLGIVAIGPLGAAFIDTDPITTPHALTSKRSNIHAALGSLFIFGFPVAATAAGIGAAHDPAVGSVLAWATLIPWVTLVWFFWTAVRHAQPGVVGAPDVRVGWPNRVSILAYLAWAALAAVTMLR